MQTQSKKNQFDIEITQRKEKQNVLQKHNKTFKFYLSFLKSVLHGTTVYSKTDITFKPFL